MYAKMTCVLLLSASVLLVFTNALSLSEAESNPLGLNCEEYLLAPEDPLGVPRKVRVCVPATSSYKTPNAFWDLFNIREPALNYATRSDAFSPVHTNEAQVQSADAEWEQSRDVTIPNKAPSSEALLLNRFAQVPQLPYPVQAAQSMNNRESNEIEPVNNEIGWQLPAPVDVSLVRRLNSIGDDVAAIKNTLSDLTTSMKSYVSSTMEKKPLPLPAAAAQRNDEHQLNIRLKIENAAGQRNDVITELYSTDAQSPRQVLGLPEAADFESQMLGAFLQGIMHSIGASQRLPTREENTDTVSDEKENSDDFMNAATEVSSTDGDDTLELSLADINEKLNELFYVPTSAESTSDALGVESTSSDSIDESDENADADLSISDDSEQNDAEWQDFLRRFIISRSKELYGEGDSTTEVTSEDIASPEASNENVQSERTTSEIVDNSEGNESQEDSQAETEATTDGAEASLSSEENTNENWDNSSNSNEKSSEERWKSILEQFLLTTEKAQDYTEEAESSTTHAPLHKEQTSEEASDDNDSRADYFYDEYDFFKRFYDSTTPELTTEKVIDLIDSFEVSEDKSSEENDRSDSKENDYNEYMDDFMQRYFERVTAQAPTQKVDDLSSEANSQEQSEETAQATEETVNKSNYHDSSEDSNENNDEADITYSNDDNGEDSSEQESTDDSTEKSVNCDISRFANVDGISPMTRTFLTKIVCPNDSQMESVEQVADSEPDASYYEW